MTPPIDRGFRRIAPGLIHYREAGQDTGAPPLVLIHGGPGSSAGLVPLIASLSATRWVIAPDLMGNGDSDPPPDGPVTISFHAECVALLLDSLGMGQVDVYGHHTGAQVACELAIAQPARVRRLVLDGVALFPPEQRAEFAVRYAPPIVPTESGAHLAWAWDFARDLTRYFPHYHRDDAHRILPSTTLPPEAVTRIAVDLLKVWPTYHLLYKAAFAHELSARLPLVSQQTLLLEIAGDPLATYVAKASKLLPASRIRTSSRETRDREISAFLSDRDHLTLR